MTMRRAIIGLVALVAAGCVANGLKTDYEMVIESRVAYLRSHPETDARTREAILASNLLVGMMPDQVVAAWGPPYRRFTMADKRTVEWIFGCDYPHICVRDERRRLLEDPRFLPRAWFYDGRLSDWRR